MLYRNRPPHGLEGCDGGGRDTLGRLVIRLHLLLTRAAKRRRHVAPAIEHLARILNLQRIEGEQRAEFCRLAAHVLRAFATSHAVEVGARELIAVEHAVETMSTVDPRKAQLFELRFYADLTMTEIAVILGAPRHAVARDWQFVKCWVARAVCHSGDVSTVVDSTNHESEALG